jgi:hypothetical protein
VTPVLPTVFDQLTLTARVASAAGDAGLRARLLDAVDVLDRERRGIRLFSIVAQHARGILERDAEALVAARGVALNRLRGHCFTRALPRTPAAS